MNVRGIGDGYALQRLLWLLIGMVIVPTMLLSLFGVMAIRNQRAAILQRLDRDRAERLEIGARALATEVEGFEHRLLRDAACLEREDECTTEIDEVDGDGAWRSGEAVPTWLQALGLSERHLSSDRLTWITPPDGSAPIAIATSGPLHLASRLEPSGLMSSVIDRIGDQLPRDTTLLLEPSEPLPGSAMEEAIARLSQPTRAELQLPRPLSGWTLRLDEDDPTRAVLRRNGWIYPISLVSLVTLVIAGAVFTLGTAAREIRLSRLQTDFVSSVSHELRTPLTSIRLFVETLQSGRLQDPDKVAECLDLLALETDRLSRMIERVLDWARMEAGRRVYDLQPVSPAELAGATLRALRSQNLLSDETIKVEVSPDLPELQVDHDAIVEALLNLLQNALKYTPPPREILFRGRHREDGVAFEVSDNGPGIPKQERKRIFEKFYQIDASLSSPTQGRVDRGSGLGLSIVRAVARAHGGRVQVHSELGVGSRFVLWLPLRRTPR